MILFLIATPPAIADDRQAIVGIGVSTCQQYLERANIRDDLAFAYISWTQGFLSGNNTKYLISDHPSLDLSDDRFFEKWLRDYCQTNPSHLYFAANVNLWRYLQEQQGFPVD